MGVSSTTDFVISTFVVVTIFSSKLGLGHCKQQEELELERGEEIASKKSVSEKG